MKNSTSRRRIALSAVVATAVGLSVAGAGPVDAKGGVKPKIVTGTCTGTTGSWKLKAKPDSGNVLEIEFEVDTNRIGQAWNVVIKDNGNTVFSGVRKTLSPSGSFSVEIRPANLAGVDNISAVATRGTRSCSGALSI